MCAIPKDRLISRSKILLRAHIYVYSSMTGASQQLYILRFYIYETRYPQPRREISCGISSGISIPFRDCSQARISTAEG